MTKATYSDQNNKNIYEIILLNTWGLLPLLPFMDD